MPKEFKKDFLAGRVKAHIRQRANGTYEVRCQYHHKKITASAKTLAEAKERFIEKLKSTESGTKVNRSVNFAEYAEKWLKTAKEPFIKPKSLSSYKERLAHPLKAFGKRNISSITATELQEFINSFEEKAAMGREVYKLMREIFDTAVADEIIPRSPFVRVRNLDHEEQHGVAFTRAEEKAVVDLFISKPSVFSSALVLCLYTGIRRAELRTVRRDGKWIIVTTAKGRKGKKDKVRKIPISPMLEKHIDRIDFEAIAKLNPVSLSIFTHKHFPAHHLHDLRHTFITRCQECGVAREIVSLWAGHAPDNSITTKVYTHLEQNEGKQLEEIAKVDYPL